MEGSRTLLWSEAFKATSGNLLLAFLQFRLDCRIIRAVAHELTLVPDELWQSAGTLTPRVLHVKSL